MTDFTSNIMKVGAHLDDTRALLRVWDDTLTDEDNTERIVEENLLGLPSRSRANDVMVRALRPRFVGAGRDAMQALQALSPNAAAFRDACFYELTRVDALVAHFASTQLREWWDEGRISITTEDARAWVDKLAADDLIPDWSPNIRDRVARGMMAALRDLGRLEGGRHSSRKEITRPGITVPGFAYVAYRLHQQGSSARSILGSDVWRRWLLDERRVDELMHRLANTGAAYYSVAGSTLRIDWRFDSFAEVVNAAL